jgi:hypothetical protein
MGLGVYLEVHVYCRRDVIPYGSAGVDILEETTASLFRVNVCVIDVAGKPTLPCLR